MSALLDELDKRGCIKQCSDRALLEKTLQKPSTFYLGIDPTGASLHVGHLLPIILSLHLARAGHYPIMLVGAGTARIGDPSGKTESRPILDDAKIEKNAEHVTAQIQKIFDAYSVDVSIVNNKDWLNKIHYIDFLRDIGKHFSVNRMLTFETYRQRIQGNGLSFIEFNYQLLQSYDFLMLFQKHNCVLQVGGDDQWGNIISGVDLIRRIQSRVSADDETDHNTEGKTDEQDRTIALTCPLITTSDGKKMGKTEAGAIFLDPEIIPPYDFFQYWRNIADDDVERFFKLYTMLPVEEIIELCKEDGAALNPVKERLAWEMTSLIHGAQEADAALESARNIFVGAKDSSTMPQHRISSEALNEGISLPELFVLAGLCNTRSDARRLVQQGGAWVNDVCVKDVMLSIDKSYLVDDCIVLRAGKKKYCAVRTE